MAKIRTTQDQRDLDQQVAEPADAALELGLRRPEPKTLGDRAELVSRPVRTTSARPCR